jgi:hypothetical protein
MISISILEREWGEGDPPAPGFWRCLLELTDTDTSETWYLPATAPGAISDEAELAVYFREWADYLWQLACERRYAPDLYRHVAAPVLVRALAALLLGEINALRAKAGLPVRTADEWKAAMVGRLK